jgi:hypothetical protein
MTDRILTCNQCGNTVAVIRDGKIKKGVVCYCKECEAMRTLAKQPKVEMPDIPDFLRGFCK